jgi:hypothetical protein
MKKTNGRTKEKKDKTEQKKLLTYFGYCQCGRYAGGLISEEIHNAQSRERLCETAILLSTEVNE